MLGKFALQFPNGNKWKCCVRNDQHVGVAAAHVALRSLCIFWLGSAACSKGLWEMPWAAQRSRVGNTSQSQWDPRRVLSYPHWEAPTFSFPLSSFRAGKCFTDLSHVKVLVQISIFLCKQVYQLTGKALNSDSKEKSPFLFFKVISLFSNKSWLEICLMASEQLNLNVIESR